jgi:hypothetical protein
LGSGAEELVFLLAFSSGLSDASFMTASRVAVSRVKHYHNWLVVRVKDERYKRQQVQFNLLSNHLLQFARIICTNSAALTIIRSRYYQCN